ncbi:hypothetical protein [Yoonia sp. R2-816]|uniref:hypothetical protein n=1 Tax=Yoonia sp. R2-816 TaxID=3342638 RepID=UPI00372D1957
MGEHLPAMGRFFKQRLQNESFGEQSSSILSQISEQGVFQHNLRFTDIRHTLPWLHLTRVTNSLATKTTCQ